MFHFFSLHYYFIFSLDISCQNKLIQMDDINNLDESVLKNLGGLDSNNLLHILDTPDEEDEDPHFMKHSPYNDMESLAIFMTKPKKSIHST